MARAAKSTTTGPGMFFFFGNQLLHSFINMITVILQNLQEEARMSVNGRVPIRCRLLPGKNKSKAEIWFILARIHSCAHRQSGTNASRDTTHI